MNPDISLDDMDETIRTVHHIMVRYPQFKRLLSLMDECRRESKYAAEPQCMCIEGETGAGKSTLAESLEKMYPRFDDEDRTVIPILYLLTPSPATVGAMLDALLDALGEPGGRRGTLPAKERRVKILLKQCRVEMVIFDDFQHLVDSETEYVLNHVSEWLKALIKLTKTPFVVMGMPGKVSQVINANKQLSRLFAAREEIKGFGWDEHDAAKQMEFARFVAYVESLSKFRLCPEMERIELLGRIHYATDGTVGNIMNLIRRAILLAHGDSTKDVGLHHFDLAFERRMRQHMKGKSNPFPVLIGARFAPPSNPERTSDSSDAVGSRGKGRKPRNPGISEVLST